MPRPMWPARIGRDLPQNEGVKVVRFGRQVEVGSIGGDISVTSSADKSGQELPVDSDFGGVR
jgi:hypothetical protein